jgi:hypothetical protein
MAHLGCARKSGGLSRDRVPDLRTTLIKVSVMAPSVLASAHLYIVGDALSETGISGALEELQLFCAACMLLTR